MIVSQVNFFVISECKTEEAGDTYQGKIAKTKSGLVCQRWYSQTPHKHAKRDPSMFPDVSVSAANNYCRNPDQERADGPWCYTMDPEVPTEACDVPMCGTFKSNENMVYMRELSNNNS